MVHNGVVGLFLEGAVSSEGISIVVAFLRDTRVGYDNIKMQIGAGDGYKRAKGADVARTEGEATPLNQ